jgi:hypothetical protein
MKTALELLGGDRELVGHWTRADLELVAQRAREEMRGMAAGKAIDMLAAFGDANCDRCRASDDVAEAIRALPVTT